MAKDDIIVLAMIGMIPVVGAATTVALEKVVTKYGHSFMQMGPKSTILIGTIGAVQNLAAIFFSISIFLIFDEDYDHKWIHLLVGSTIAAVMLFGATALAAKVNLISTRLSLFTAAALMIKSFIEITIIRNVAEKI